MPAAKHHGVSSGWSLAVGRHRRHIKPKFLSRTRSTSIYVQDIYRRVDRTGDGVRIPGGRLLVW
jgi:hypothetical protein